MNTKQAKSSAADASATLLSNTQSAIERRLGPIEYRKPGALTPYEGNPRKHPEKQLVQLMASIGHFGFAYPLLIDAQGVVITGHARLEAAMRFERWFSREIETPFAGALTRLLALDGIERRKSPGRGDPTKRKEVQELGFIVGDFDERMPLTAPVRMAIAKYLAALVVRSPDYLNKLTDWHRANYGSGGLPVDPTTFRGFALENMLFLYDVYRVAIAGSYISLMIADCDREFLFADGGVTAQEPWSKRLMPFDLYAPLTPKLAFNVLPLPDAYTGGLWISRVNARGVARYNRMMIADAKRFVFSKSPPPLAFVAKHFGVPVPSPFGSRWIDGKLETKYNRSRDRSL